MGGAWGFKTSMQTSIKTSKNIGGGEDSSFLSESSAQKTLKIRFKAWFKNQVLKGSLWGYGGRGAWGGFIFP
jgi:hypothetical protein